jgi:hypothetical protein
MESYYLFFVTVVAQTGLELWIFMLQSPECWDYRCPLQLRSRYVMCIALQFRKMKAVRGDDGHTTSGMYLVPQNCTLKNGHDGKVCVMWLFLFLCFETESCYVA